MKKKNINGNLLKQYIGKNYDKINTKLFNIFGFLFTSFYMYYRKMYLYGIIVFVFQILFSMVLKNYYLMLIINVLVGFLVNKVYIIQAKRKIIKISNENKEKTNTEIEEICEVSGGTSIYSVFIGILIELVIGALLFMIFSSIIKNNEDDNTPIYISTYTPGIYSGIIYNSFDVVIGDEFEISVPPIFTDYSYKEQFRYQYYIEEENVFRCCRFSLKLIEDFTSSENLIRDMSHYYSEQQSTEVKNEVINGINWYWFSYEDDIGKIYYYGMNKNNNLYLLDYVVQGDIDGSCESYRNEVIHSIKVK